MNSDYDPTFDQPEYVSPRLDRSETEGVTESRPEGNTTLKRLLAGSLVLVLFCGGMFVSFGAGVFFQREVIADPGNTDQQVEVFNNAWEIVQANYVQEEVIDEDAMLEGAIDGMLATLGDEGHTRYLTAEETEADRQRSQGVYVGVGVEVEEHEQGLQIQRIFPGSPAEAGELQPDDIIIAVDGEDISEMPQGDAVQLIRGPIGTSVALTILRPSTGEELVFDLERLEIQVSAVTWTMLEGNIALIRLEQFSSRSADDMETALRIAQDRGAEGIILDLRGNPGGYIREAEEIASMFIPEDAPIFISRTREGGEEISRAEEVPVHVGDLPVIVMIDSGSASASEIVSGAIKSQAENATVIGETTVGTGTVLRQFELGDGSTIWLGIELWLTPEGEMIREQGITPEITVSLAEGQHQFHPDYYADTGAPDIDELDDDQLEYAIELINSGEAALPMPPSVSAPAPAAW